MDSSDSQEKRPSEAVRKSPKAADDIHDKSETQDEDKFYYPGSDPQE